MSDLLIILISIGFSFLSFIGVLVLYVENKDLKNYNKFLIESKDAIKKDPVSFCSPSTAYFDRYNDTLVVFKDLVKLPKSEK